MIINSQFPFNKNVLIALDNILNEYEIMSNTKVEINSNEKTTLSDHIKHKCRFCGKSKPDVKFKLIAHAIPDFLGNKNLFSNYECDNCNKFFSQFESEFANFMLQFNTIAGTISKGNSPPKYKMGENLQMYNDNKTLHVGKLPNEIFENKTKFEFELPIPSYIPEWIYRALIKIGLTLVPEDKLELFRSAFHGLMDKSYIFPIQPCMIFSIFSFSYDINKINCTLYYKKESVERNIPQAIMVLSYKNFCFQTFFPLINDLKYGEEFYPFPYVFPSQLDNIDGIEKDYGGFFLDGRTRIKDEKAKIYVESKDGIIIREQPDGKSF